MQGLEAWLRQRAAPKAVAEVVAGGWLTESQVRDRIDAGLGHCVRVRTAIAQGQAAVAVWEVLQLLRLVAVLPGAPLLDPVCLLFHVSDKQRSAVGGRYAEEQRQAAELARRLWWDADRQQPGPRSTDGCELIAAQLEAAGYKRRMTGTIKRWLSKDGLIPEWAKKGGAPTNP